jgi:hypothetical protein
LELTIGDINRGLGNRDRVASEVVNRECNRQPPIVNAIANRQSPMQSPIVNRQCNRQSSIVNTIGNRQSKSAIA